MITMVEWDNDPILKNLRLNFAKEDGTPYKTIVIAGENGTGKTHILETISTFLNLGTIEPFKEITYEVDGVHYTIAPNKEYTNIGFHLRRKEGEEKSTLVSGCRTSDGQEKIKGDKLDIRHYGCCYSKARSGFSTKPVKSSTTQQLDVDLYDNDTSEDFTVIKQLIVDIKTQDNSFWDRICASGKQISYQEFHKTSKIYRFEKAFNEFFESIKFIGVDEEARDEKRVVFAKNGNDISIDNLSTGEKQIVFRGAQLLKNSRNLTGGVVLIDEPELSMHPKWQARVFDYYRGLFSIDEEQNNQIIFATHSENVIHAAVKDPDSLIIILSDENGTIKATKMGEMILPTKTAAEINYLAFDVASIDYHIALYGYLQTLGNKQKISETDKFIQTQPEYDSAQHGKIDTTHNITYYTLPTYIRNAIDHPDSQRKYTPQELITSIKLLRNICNRLNKQP